MAKWVAICQPKIYGDIGIINTEIMNQCLLTKWIWKIQKVSEELWSKILETKYMQNGSFWFKPERFFLVLEGTT